MVFKRGELLNKLCELVCLRISLGQATKGSVEHSKHSLITSHGLSHYDTHLHFSEIILL